MKLHSLFFTSALTSILMSGMAIAEKPTREELQNMSAEERQAAKANRRAEIDAMSSEERQALREERRSKRESSDRTGEQQSNDSAANGKGTKNKQKKPARRKRGGKP